MTLPTDFAALVGLPLDTCMWRSGERALYSSGETLLVEVHTATDEVEAATLMARRQASANRASLHPEAFVPVAEVRAAGPHVVVTYPVVPGVLLPQYLDESFGEYMAEETFALELAFHLTECARVARGPLAFDLHDVWLTDAGEVRLLRAPSDDVSERQALRAAGEMLFALLTRTSAEGRPDALLRSQEVNGEISSSAEAIIRRCVQGVEGGGFGSLASLRHALTEALRSRGCEPSGGRLRDFRRHRPRVAYEEALTASVVAEREHLDALRSPGPRDRFERVLRRVFADPEKQGLRPLWIPLVLGYVVLVAPFLLVRMRTETLLAWMGGLLFIYVAMFVAISTSYRRERD